MQIHRLKTWPEYYEKVLQGLKPFEVRRDDRNFETGDIAELLEFDPESQLFSGRGKAFQIGYILKGELFGLKKGFCIFALLPDTRNLTPRADGTTVESTLTSNIDENDRPKACLPNLHEELAMKQKGTRCLKTMIVGQ